MAKEAKKASLAIGGETVLKLKVPPARIENSLSPLYRGTDFTTLAETFQTVWGGVKNSIFAPIVIQTQ